MTKIKQKNNYIKSPLNYTGGKHKLLPQILPLFPEDVNVFVDLFCGGGDVGVNVDAKHVICNDLQSQVIDVLKMFQKSSYEILMDGIYKTINEYKLTDTSTHGYKYYGCNSNDGVSKYNKESFTQLRIDYNNGRRDPLTFYIMLMYSFNNYIKFNKGGEFANSSANKRDFNKSLKKKIKNFVEAPNLQKIRFTNMDYKNFNIDNLKQNDFVYVDPPYLITNVSYTDEWNEQCEKDLLMFLDKLNSKNIKFALSNVLKHKGKTNELLIDWSSNYNVYNLNFHYANCNYKTNASQDNKSREVLITNY